MDADPEAVTDEDVIIPSWPPATGYPPVPDGCSALSPVSTAPAMTRYRHPPIWLGIAIVVSVIAFVLGAVNTYTQRDYASAQATKDRNKAAAASQANANNAFVGCLSGNVFRAQVRALANASEQLDQELLTQFHVPLAAVRAPFDRFTASITSVQDRDCVKAYPQADHSLTPPPDTP